MTVCSRPIVENYKVILAGGLAGCGFWIVGYPVDSVKSRIQVRVHASPRSVTELPIYLYHLFRVALCYLLAAWLWLFDNALDFVKYFQHSVYTS